MCQAGRPWSLHSHHGSADGPDCVVTDKQAKRREDQGLQATCEPPKNDDFTIIRISCELQTSEVIRSPF